MTPDQREEALAKLPPERRARMEKQLSRYENLTPAQKAQVQRRLEMLQLAAWPQKAVASRATSTARDASGGTQTAPE